MLNKIIAVITTVVAIAACGGNDPQPVQLTFTFKPLLSAGVTLASGEAKPKMACSLHGELIDADGIKLGQKVDTAEKSAEVDSSFAFTFKDDGVGPGDYTPVCRSLTAGFELETQLNLIQVRTADQELKVYIKRDGSTVTPPDKCSASFTVKDNLSDVTVKEVSSNASCVAPCTLSALPCGATTFTASKTAYKSDTWQTTLVAGTPASHEFSLESAPLTGEILCTCKDSAGQPLNDCQFSAGGTNTCSTGAGMNTCYIGDLAPGVYDVVGSKTGYTTSNPKSVTVVAEQDTPVEFNLTPDVGSGSVIGSCKDSVTSANIKSCLVSDAAGTYKCTTAASDGAPCTITGVPAGSLSLTASASGYTTSAAKSVTVVANGSVNADFVLVVVPADTGLIDTFCQEGTLPLSGCLMSAGSYTCTSGADGKCSISAPAGTTYQVVASINGYVTSAAQTSATVVAGQHTPVLVFTLVKVPTGTGAVTFKCVEYPPSVPPKPLPGCIIREVNLGTGLTCTGNSPYGVCQIAGLPFGVSLRFTAELPGYSIASWPTSSSAPQVVIQASQPLLIHTFDLAK